MLASISGTVSPPGRLPPSAETSLPKRDRFWAGDSKSWLAQNTPMGSKTTRKINMPMRSTTPSLSTPYLID